ncbi:MAG: hypothetical protein CSB23_03750 [Deltaproteobacteria bacterium]|nr:MAG: hypothetical protein CSB23_03750 [Deltaproteobacteria bacterium]
MKRLHYVFVLCFFAVLSSGVALAVQNVSVAKDKANVRTGPGTNHPKVMELFTGYPLQVVSKKGDWLEVVDYEKDSGWIHNSLVKAQDTVIVVSKNLINMRSGPSTKDDILADVQQGVVLQKLSSQGQWTKVRHSNGLVGWIYSPLLWP